MDDNMKKAYRTRHRMACVTAYELLEKVWPPTHGVEYWEKDAQMFADTDNLNRDNPLLRPLLVAIYNHLGHVLTDGSTDAAQDHKVAFRVLLDTVDDIVAGEKISQAPEIIDLTRGKYPDNKLLHAMLDMLPQYLTRVQNER